MGVKISANSPLRHSEMAASKQIGNQKGGPPDVSGSFKTQGKRQRAPLSVCEVGNLFDGRAAHRLGNDFGTCEGSARWIEVLFSRPTTAWRAGRNHRDQQLSLPRHVRKQQLRHARH